MQHAMPFAPDECQIVSVSPFDEDHFSLQRIVRNCSREGLRRRLFAARDLPSAMEALKGALAPVIVCEQRLPVGGWQDLLERIEGFAWPPPLIVTSRHADEYLWAEALNRGAYDVLAKPFDPAETGRVISLACLRSGPRRVAVVGRLA